MFATQSILLLLLVVGAQCESAERYMEYIVGRHNNFRQGWFNGKEWDRMEWDSSLAEEADRRMSQCNMGNGYYSRGEHYAYYSGGDHYYNIRRAFNDWYNGMSQFDWRNNEGNSYQMDWYRSRSVGCAMNWCPSFDANGQNYQNMWFFGCFYDQMEYNENENEEFFGGNNWNGDGFNGWNGNDYKNNNNGYNMNYNNGYGYDDNFYNGNYYMNNNNGYGNNDYYRNRGYYQNGNYGNNYYSRGYYMDNYNNNNGNGYFNNMNHPYYNNWNGNGNYYNRGYYWNGNDYNNDYYYNRGYYMNNYMNNGYGNDNYNRYYMNNDFNNGYDNMEENMECDDRMPNCDENMCSNKMFYMRFQCRRTCGFC
ncbi:probable serine/threonine-protein kinase clkA [Ruditapes philippinarum]|uniref:probable serine/threonine-protein kinase clkA n=1 Tax=Ruditapes philippinarum TaxID=129788 RepID=UPI00295A5971|nr:probable serine/threonine-protein kinase clkA [Ruditapes philippinarum]